MIEFGGSLCLGQRAPMHIYTYIQPVNSEGREGTDGPGAGIGIGIGYFIDTET